MTHISWDLIVMQMIMGLALGSIFVLAASGLSIILGLMDVVNFAHGTFYMLGAYATYVVISYSGSFWVGVISALLLVAVLGGLVEVFTLKPLYGKDPLYPLLMTFGFSVAIPDLVKMIFGLIGKVVEYPPVLSGVLSAGPIYISKYRLFIILLTFFIMFSLMLFLKKSSLGMIIRAATRDKLMVNVLGIDTSRIWTIGFMIGVSLAALAGALAAPMVAAVPEMGIEMTVECFVVVVIGGLGSLGGAILGGLLIGQIVSFVSLFAPEYTSVSIFCGMAAVLLWRPRGLFGEEGRV
jgi:branched-chain amino acid transport system permease protein